MPEAVVGVVVKPLGPGLWDVTAFGYLNEVKLENRIKEGGWVELWEVPGWGQPNKLIVDSTDLSPQGHIIFGGLRGSDSDAPAWMKVYWLVVHYQRGHPGAPQGPEYRVTHDFWLGLNAWVDGVDTATEIVGLGTSPITRLALGLGRPALPLVASIGGGLALVLYGAKRR